MGLLRLLFTLFRRDKFTTFQEGYLEETKQVIGTKESLSRNEYIISILLILFDLIFLFARSVFNGYRGKAASFFSSYGLLVYVILGGGGLILIFGLVIASLALPIHYLVNRKFNLLSLIGLISSPFFIFIIRLIFNTISNRKEYY